MPNAVVVCVLSVGEDITIVVLTTNVSVSIPSLPNAIPVTLFYFDELCDSQSSGIQCPLIAGSMIYSS